MGHDGGDDGDDGDEDEDDGDEDDGGGYGDGLEDDLGDDHNICLCKTCSLPELQTDGENSSRWAMVVVMMVMMVMRVLLWVNVRIAHLRIAYWGAILSPSVIRIAHP